jgi:UDP-glucose 4-epimerase
MSVSKYRYVVFGSNGFVGNAVASNLEKKGITTIRVTRKDHDFLSRSLWHQINFLNENDILIFAAAQAPVKSFNGYQDNMAILENFLLNFAKRGFRYLVNISSDAVYSDSLEAIYEDSPLGPTSLHGCMHLVREIALSAAFGEQVLNVRPTLIFGPQDPHGGYGPNKFIREANTQGVISLYGRGEELRDHIYIDDVGEIVVRASLNRVTGVLNATTGKVTSFLQIAELIAQQGENISIDFLPRVSPPPHLGIRKFSNKRISELFPDFVYTSLNEGLDLSLYQFGSK